MSSGPALEDGQLNISIGIHVVLRAEPDANYEDRCVECASILNSKDKGVQIPWK